MSARRQISILFAVVLLACLSASVFTLRQLDQVRRGSAVQELLFVPSPKIVKAMSLGYTGLMADIYWTRAVQYFGRNHHTRKLEYQYLGPLLEITAALDPHLIPTYEFGSVFLAQKPPEGAGQPDRAVDLVEYGIQHNPEYWRLCYSLGFIHWMERKDSAAASAAFLRGSKVPGAHPWMKTMAAITAQDSGDRNTARLLWEAMYETTSDKNVKNTALKHIVAIRVDDEVDALETLVLKYKQQTGSKTATWSDLIRAGLLKGVPTDPDAHPYLLVEDGSVLVKDVEAFPFLSRGLVQHGGASDSSQTESKTRKAS